MQKELQDAADIGFEYVGQTVFSTALGGNEVVVILERDKRSGQSRLITSWWRRRRPQRCKELLTAGAAGYELLAMTVSQTALGGSELVAITRRPRAR